MTIFAKYILKTVLHNANSFNSVNGQPVPLFCPLTLQLGKKLSMFPLYIGLAKQNSVTFNIAGRLAALLPLLKYYVHFSWDRREENSNFLKFPFTYF
jgi:hypothetical protein